MQINFYGQYDRELFFRAVKLANQKTKGRLRFLYFVLLVGFGALGVVIYRLYESSDFRGNVVYLVAIFIITGVAVYDLLQPHLTARKLWANPGVQRELTGRITNKGIAYVFPEGTNEISWDKFNRLKKNSDLITLVRRDGLLLVFPRRFFKNASDWQKFDKLVTSRVVTTRAPRKRSG